MPTIVEVPKIERPGRSGVSKYVDPDTVTEAVALIKARSGWVGDLTAPVDSIIKARQAARKWRKVFSDALGLPEEAFATRVFSPRDKKGQPIADMFTFALAIKEGAPNPE